MCSVGDKARRRMLDNATVTGIYPVEDTFFNLHIQVNFMVIAFPATNLISLAMAI
jgi:hypothetical protein